MNLEILTNVCSSWEVSITKSQQGIELTLSSIIIQPGFSHSRLSPCFSSPRRLIQYTYISVGGLHFFSLPIHLTKSMFTSQSPCNTTKGLFSDHGRLLLLSRVFSRLEITRHETFSRGRHCHGSQSGYRATSREYTRDPAGSGPQGLARLVRQTNCFIRELPGLEWFHIHI